MPKIGANLTSVRVRALAWGKPWGARAADLSAAAAEQEDGPQDDTAGRPAAFATRHPPAPPLPPPSSTRSVLPPLPLLLVGLSLRPQEFTTDRKQRREPRRPDKFAMVAATRTAAEHATERHLEHAGVPIAFDASALDVDVGALKRIFAEHFADDGPGLDKGCHLSSFLTCSSPSFAEVPDPTPRPFPPPQSPPPPASPPPPHANLPGRAPESQTMALNCPGARSGPSF